MNFLLVILSASPILLTSLRHKDNFNRLFSLLSFCFTMAFYGLPLAYAGESGRISYLGQSALFHEADRNDALVALFIFSCGFLLSDLTIRNDIKESINEFRESNKHIAAIIVIIDIITCYYVNTSNYYEISSEIRSYGSGGNHLTSTIILCVYYINCFLLIISLSRHNYKMAFIWFSFALFLVLSFGGRFQVAIVLLIPIMHFARRPIIPIIIGIVGAIVLFPLLLEGKSIIAAISTGQSVSEAVRIAYTSGLDIEKVLNNFSHPFISYFYAPSLVDEIGYRYFWDIPQGFLFYLRLFGIDFGDSLTYFNTELIIRKRESIIPPGYLAFGYIQANYIGVFFTGMIFRFSGRAAEFVKSQIRGRLWAADFYLAFIAANTFYIGEVRGLVLTFIFPCALMYLIIKLEEKKY
ncbi:MAG: hypothetical protein ACR2PC_04300 [Tsuneonella suprasediminis]|nr:hypothetical protein LBX01_03090 [Altererythrobacter sp. N1]